MPEQPITRTDTTPAATTTTKATAGPPKRTTVKTKPSSVSRTPTRARATKPKPTSKTKRAAAKGKTTPTAARSKTKTAQSTSSKKRSETTKALATKDTTTATTEVLSAREVQLLDEAVAFINKTVVDTVDRGLRAIGEYLLDAIFDGDPALVSSKRRDKLVTFRALAARTDLSLSPTYLSQAVRLVAQEREMLAANVKSISQIGSTHGIQLLKVPDVKQKAKLANAVVDEKLSVRQLQQRVDQAFGKKPNPASGHDTNVKGLPRPITALAALDPGKALNETTIAKMTPGEKKDCRAALVQARTCVNRMIRSLDKA